MKHETLCLHGGHQPDSETHSRAVPIYKSTAFTFNDTEHAANLFALKELGNIYTRLMNPTTDVLEKRICLLEGAHELAGLAHSSGTAAIFNSIINLAQAGDNIVSARNLYGGSYTQFNDILPALGIEVRFVDSQDPQQFANAIDDKTRALFCETVSNPALEVTDLEAVGSIAKENGIPLIVDATCSTPYLTQPLAHGADIVVHSLTKWLGGHGTGLGGIVIDSGRFNWAGVDDDAAEASAVSAEPFGEGMDDDVGSVVERTGEVGRRASGIDDEGDAVGFGNLADGVEIGDFEGGVGDGLAEKGAGFFVNRVCELLGIL